MRRTRLKQLIMYSCSRIAAWPCLALTAPADARERSSISPALQAALRSQPADQQMSVIVVLKTQENVRAIRGSNRADRQRKVVQALRKRADADQKNLRTLLRQLRQQGHVQILYTAVGIQRDHRHRR